VDLFLVINVKIISKLGENPAKYIFSIFVGKVITGIQLALLRATPAQHHLESLV